MNQKAIIQQAFTKHGVSPRVGWAIYGAESSWGKAPASFGLTGDYPSGPHGRGTSGNFVKDANRSAEIMARLIRETGSYEAALRKYSGGGYGMAHVKELLATNPYGRGPGLPAGAAFHPKNAQKAGPLTPFDNDKKTQLDVAGVMTQALLSGSKNVLLEAQSLAGSGRFQLPAAPKAIPSMSNEGSPLVGSGRIGTFIARAAKIESAHPRYLWGGGHGGSPAKLGVPVDCSGAVSQVLGIAPRVSGAFGSVGKPGRGRVNIYYNAHHVFMEIDGHFFGTSLSNPGHGAGWIARSHFSAAYLRGFKVRHVA